MKIWLALIATVCSSGVIAGPLGLEMGTPFDELNKQFTLKQERPYEFSTTTLPKGHPDFNDYRLVITPKHGLCKIDAWSETISTSVYGTELKSRFEKLETALISKYGQEENRVDGLRPGSIWNEPRDWMMGLLKKERFLLAHWESKGRELPDNIGFIVLRAYADATERGTIQLGYEFKTSKDCMDWIKAQKDSTL